MKKEIQGHLIQSVDLSGIACEMGIEAGDRLLSIDGQEITDIFDYQYLIQNEYIEALIRKKSGEEWLLEIDKEYEEDLGVAFENGLMDEYRSCRNKCIFCFIDQMPKGMRETLYFKDDDSRLSFLQGNYVTLTNLSEQDMERIIRYRLSPINVSVHTTNPELRCRMLHNRFAGEALRKMERFYEAGIEMNGQIVLCRGINDGEELDRSIRELSRYLPLMGSVSVVPVGLSRYRDGLYPLQPFDRESAGQVLRQIHAWQDRMYLEAGIHFVHASDEWYLLAGEELPGEDHYDGYPQLENGVGMLRLLTQEFRQALEERERTGRFPGDEYEEELSMATGVLAYPTIRRMTDEIIRRCPGLTVHLYPITNDFFGERITVSGLLTGQDIRRQLAGKPLGKRLLIPQNVLRSGEDYFLDDVTLGQLQKALQVPVDIVKSSGRDFVDTLLRIV